MTMEFPSPMPAVSTEFYYMERHKLHSTRPRSEHACSVWGGWNPSHASWTSLCVVSNPSMAGVYRRRLSDLVTAADPTARTRLGSHWTELLHYLYHIGFNNARLITRDGTKTLNKIVGRTDRPSRYRDEMRS